MVDFNAMNSQELVQEYNRMASERGLPIVKRFATAAAGRRRCAIIQKAQRPAALDILLEFKTSSRKNRGKLLKALFDDKGEQVAIGQLIRAVYGSANLARSSALKMIMRGLEGSIKKDRLPYMIKKLKSETGAISYGLYQA